MGRKGRGPSGAIHGRSGRRAPQPGSEGILRASFGGRQTEEGGIGGLHAQAALDPQRYPQTPYSLEISSVPFPLTSKTVASSCPYSPGARKADSPKFISTIPHILTPIRAENG